jgi:CheY-like chemotaxis protein
VRRLAQPARNSVGHDDSREAAGGVSAIEAFEKHRPDVTLMDLRMPDMTGAEATAAIRKKSRTLACGINYL